MSNSQTQKECIASASELNKKQSLVADRSAETLSNVAKAAAFKSESDTDGDKSMSNAFGVAGDGDAPVGRATNSASFNHESQCTSSSSAKISKTVPESETIAENAEEDDKEVSVFEEAATGHSIFIQVMYLGCSTVENAESEEELLQIVGERNQLQPELEGTLSISATQRDGAVKLLHCDTNAELCSFSMQLIRFVVRGRDKSEQQACFAFSYAPEHRHTTPAFKCHVFKCSVLQAVSRVLSSFQSAFGSARSQSDVCGEDLLSRHMAMPHELSGAVNHENEFLFEAFLEVKEEDVKRGGGHLVCPQERNCFKLRCNRDKKLVFVIRQISGPQSLTVQKCFGLLLAPGRNVRHSDMQLLDMQSMSNGQDKKVYVIDAVWQPNSAHFQVLNTETPRDTRVFMTVAADIVLLGVREPIRFIIECKARIFHEHERFWYITRKPIVEQYTLLLRKVSGATASGGDNAGEFEVSSFESGTQREFREKQRVSQGGQGRSPGKMAAQLIHPADDDESDSDEPLLSGSGEVCRECSEPLLNEWTQTLSEWTALDPTGCERPKQLAALIRQGIPEMLRSTVWPLLCACANDAELFDTYRLLIAKDCDSEQVILRDIHRTFPAHEHFKHAGGDGQDQLLKLSKAYALYDEEVGYCQGLSFLAASLLLHLPEEQAFCVLVKIMFDYGLRDLFKPGFDALLVRFYQLERLIEDYIPDLNAHLNDLHVEGHMYASQWFLTLFTAKFPLSMVYHIIDLFLCEGVNTIFHISLALLKDSKKELLQLDFEGVLKFFRVALPRKYRTEQTARELIQQAVKLKMSHKRLAKYEKEYRAWKQQEADTLDPVVRLEREKVSLKETVMRLERENDDLAHELVTSKIELRTALDAAEDNVESLRAQVEHLTRANNDFTEENKQLHEEYDQVKSMCRKEMQRLEDDNARQQNIIVNYKQICSDLSHRLEAQQTNNSTQHKRLINVLSACASCSAQMADGASDAEATTQLNDDSPQEPESPGAQLRSLEVKLAEAKLMFVESECQNQELTRQLNQACTELDTFLAGKQNKEGTWFKKTFSSLRDNATAALRTPTNSTSNTNSTNSTTGNGHTEHTTDR